MVLRYLTGAVPQHRHILPVLIVKWTNQDFQSLGWKIAIGLVKAVSQTNIFIVGLSRADLTN